MHGRRLPSAKWIRKLWIVILAILGAALPATIFLIPLNTAAKASPVNIAGIFCLFFLIAASFPLAYFAQQEAVHTPQKYKISQLALWFFLPSSVVMSFAMWFIEASGPGIKLIISVFIAGIGEYIMLSSIFIFSNMSKSMANTGEIDAIAWLLKTAPPQNPAAFFKKAGQMTGFNSIGFRYRPRLLESLIAFLSLLIISHHAPEHPSSRSDSHSPSSSLPASFDEDPQLKNLEIYIACLARLSEFTDSGGSFKCLWEDAMQHPKLEQLLVDKLVLFANLDLRRRPQEEGLRSAATKVLNNYRMDIEGKSVEGSVRSHGVATVLRNAVSSVATFFGSAASWMLNVSGLKKDQGRPNLYGPVELELSTHVTVEPPHSSGDIEEA